MFYRNLKSSLALTAIVAFQMAGQRTETTLNDGWQFTKGTP